MLMGLASAPNIPCAILNRPVLASTDQGPDNKPTVQLSKAYPEVLLVECTYRTTRYNMPPLHFIEVMPLDTRFGVAEDEVQYNAAIGVFKSIY
jgi:hypothetical protein